MARSVRTIPFAMVVVPPPPAAMTDDWKGISDEDWPKIEEAYGHKPSTAIKREILRATTSFVMFEPFERAALPLAEAKRRVQSVKDSAGKLFGDLFSGPSDDATTFADKLIDLHFKGSLRQVLLSYAAACNSVLAQMESSSSHREGAAWDQWIRDLTTILDAARLPTTASKGRGKSKSDSPSSFVSFVLELQNCVQDKARRHTTPDSLATAINRARKGLGSKSACLTKKK